jgi:hypothetical protein
MIALTCSLANLASVTVVCLLSANIKVSCNNKTIGTLNLQLASKKENLKLLLIVSIPRPVY